MSRLIESRDNFLWSLDDSMNESYVLIEMAQDYYSRLDYLVVWSEEYWNLFWKYFNDTEIIKSYDHIEFRLKYIDKKTYFKYENKNDHIFYKIELKIFKLLLYNIRKCYKDDLIILKTFDRMINYMNQLNYKCKKRFEGLCKIINKLEIIVEQRDQFLSNINKSLFLYSNIPQELINLIHRYSQEQSGQIIKKFWRDSVPDFGGQYSIKRYNCRDRSDRKTFQCI